MAGIQAHMDASRDDNAAHTLSLWQLVQAKRSLIITMGTLELTQSSLMEFEKLVRLCCDNIRQLYLVCYIGPRQEAGRASTQEENRTYQGIWKSSRPRCEDDHQGTSFISPPFISS